MNVILINAKELFDLGFFAETKQIRPIFEADSDWR